MTAWPSNPPPPRPSPGRVLLVLALLPALLSGPALGRAAAWIHWHGHSGGHVHLLRDEHARNVAALDGWHDAQHRPGHENGEHEKNGPAPKGLLIDLPELVAASPPGSTAIPAASVLALALLPIPGLHLALVESSIRPGFLRSAWPPLGSKRSGVAALLRSSHAILI
ncbi:MAG: hypothetical protein AB1726_09990 [Planctomycetota bacterium]